MKLLEARQVRCPSRMQRRPPKDAGEVGERIRGVVRGLMREGEGRRGGKGGREGGSEKERDDERGWRERENEGGGLIER